MYQALSLLAALTFGLPLLAQSSTAPSYSAASIVNSATNTAAALAPNTIATIYGVNLAYGTSGLSSSESPIGYLPQELADVRVIVGGQIAFLYYVSPQQINFLIPDNLRPGDMELVVARQGTAGPQVQIAVSAAGPGLYEWEPGMIASTHADGSIIIKAHPAQPGETVVVYGTGLGLTNPDVGGGEISMIPAQIVLLNEFHMWVAGVALASTSVEYVGVTPGTPGLYQVNFKLPKPVASNPEIRIAIGDRSSPAGLKLPVQ
jgi:uncharacterized protein (TIGR03437 family)